MGDGNWKNCCNCLNRTDDQAKLYTAAVYNLALSKDESKNYYIDVTTDQQVMSCSTTGSNGDANLYMNIGSIASDDDNDCESLSLSSNEECSAAVLAAPKRVYVAVVAYSSFSGLTFQCNPTELYTAPVYNLALS